MSRALSWGTGCRLRRVCHLLRNSSGRHLRAHLLPSQLRKRRPVDTIGEHEFFSSNLATPKEKMSLLHDGIDAFIIGNHACWNAIILL